MMENEEIETMVPLSLPFSLNDKIFICTDEETGDPIGEPYSYNDWIKQIEDISGVNEELLGMSYKTQKEHDMKEHKASTDLMKFFEKILKIKEFVKEKSKEDSTDETLIQIYKMLDETMKEKV